MGAAPADPIGVEWLTWPAAGFEVAVSRLHIGFVPISAQAHRVLEWLDYSNEKKLLF